MARTLLFSVLIAAAVVVPSGCGSSSARSFDEGGPEDEVRAVARASERGSPDDVQRLIVALDSDDQAVRMLAISGLTRLTGKTFGYDFAASRAERTEAIGRWVEWWRVESAGRSTTPTDDRAREAHESGRTGDGA